MLKKLKKLISSVQADYVDIRYEEKKETILSMIGPELKKAKSNNTDGFVVRTLKNGGFSSVTVTREEDVPEALLLAIEGSRFMSEAGNKYSLASVDPIEDSIDPKLNGDPAAVPVSEKIALLAKYNNIMLTEPEISNTDLEYNETDREKFFVSSEGTSIRERLCTLYIKGEVFAKRGDSLQSVRVGIGTANGISDLVDRDEVFVKKAKLARELLTAKQVKAGIYNVILNPELTGVFVHEAFGHTSEADGLESNLPLRKMMKIGTSLGSNIVNITADSTIPNQIGFYRYDDEGVPVRRTQLLRNGVLAGRLHSRRTAVEFSESATGHCVAEDQNTEPIVRMGNIFLEPGEVTFEELLKEMDSGLYLCDCCGGSGGVNFNFAAQYGYVVEGGKIGKMVRGINILGNLFTTLKDVVNMDNEMRFSGTGICRKGSQMNFKSGYGGPSVFVRSMKIGGI